VCIEDIRINRAKKYKTDRALLLGGGAKTSVAGRNASRTAIRFSTDGDGVELRIPAFGGVLPDMAIWRSTVEELGFTMTLEEFGDAVTQEIFGYALSGGSEVYVTEIYLDLR
jgi:hypothetical protein